MTIKKRCEPGKHAWFGGDSDVPYCRKCDFSGDRNFNTDRYAVLLRNLLAFIHRDEGQYTEKHGIEISYKDALAEINFLRDEKGD